MQLSEAEMQVLASIRAAECEGSATNRASIDARGEAYWIYKEDWSIAYEALIGKGLAKFDNTGYRLTSSGRPLGDRYRDEKPDMYWYYYQMFYSTARASATYSRLCEQVFGKDLCQDGQMDMASFDDLLQLLDLHEGDRVLDLGCGAGAIAEYISDETGAHVTGVDFAESGIAEATARTAEKKDRLQFTRDNFNTLALESDSYDAVVSIDSLYWASDLEAMVGRLAESLKPGGRMGIFMNHHIGPSESADHLEAEHSVLYKVLQNLDLSFEVHDYTESIRQFWLRLYRVVTGLQSDFEAEGNGDIATRLIHECESDYLADVENERIARYLFHVRIPSLLD